MHSPLLSLLLPIAFSYAAIAAPPAVPGGNVPSTPGPNTGELRPPQPSASTDAQAEDGGFVVVKGQVYHIAKGRASAVKEEVAVKIAPTTMVVKVSPKGITGLDGKPFEVPPGEMLSTDGRLVPRPTGVAGLPVGGAKDQDRTAQPQTPPPAADQTNRENTGANGNGPAPAGQVAPAGPAGRPGAPAIPGPDKPSNAQGSGGYPGGPLNGGEKTEKKK